MSSDHRLATTADQPPQSTTLMPHESVDQQPTGRQSRRSPQESDESSLSELADEMSVSDLDEVGQHLGIAGNLHNYRPLHEQHVLLRTIIPTQETRLHLLWFNRIIYVKVMPECLLDPTYVEKVIMHSPQLRRLVLGFLTSYLRIIRSRLDLTTAQERYLLPKTLSWEDWLEYRESITSFVKQSEDFGPRYRYGELRLSRLNIIWRMTGRGLTYFTVHREYNTYFRQYFELFVTGFALVAVALEAMQVILSAESAPGLLKIVCYRFGIAALFGVVICLSFVATVFALMAFYNTVVTVLVHSHARKKYVDHGV